MTRTLAVLALLATVAHAELIAGGLVLARPVAAGVPAPLHDWQAESDEFRRCAMKGLSGMWPLKPWQRDAYIWGLAKGVTIQGRAKKTNYCPFCAGKTCADDSPVRLGICAANPQIPMHSVLWISGVGLVRVCDRGGSVKLGKYVRRGETANLDVWCKRCPGPAHWSQRRRCWHGTGTKRKVPYAVVKTP